MRHSTCVARAGRWEHTLGVVGWRGGGGVNGRAQGCMEEEARGGMEEDARGGMEEDARGGMQEEHRYTDEFGRGSRTRQTIGSRGSHQEGPQTPRG